MKRKALRFTHEEACEASDTWGLNCGPAAVAAMCGLTLEEVRPHLGDFEAKRYTNPTLMWFILGRVCKHFSVRSDTPGGVAWPEYGLARVQWEGPWTKPGVPMRARYRYTHWVGCCRASAVDIGVWDVNCLNNGTGWVALADWKGITVPWILKTLYPRADGNWHLTHAVEIVE